MAPLIAALTAAAAVVIAGLWMRGRGVVPTAPRLRIAPRAAVRPTPPPPPSVSVPGRGVLWQ